MRRCDDQIEHIIRAAWVLNIYEQAVGKGASLATRQRNGGPTASNPDVRRFAVGQGGIAILAQGGARDAAAGLICNGFGQTQGLIFNTAPRIGNSPDYGRGLIHQCVMRNRRNECKRQAELKGLFPLDFEDLVGFQSARRVDLDHIADFLVHHGARNG